MCVTMISTSFMKINNQTITTYRIYMIFWLIFWSYFVAFLGDSLSINHPKCKLISIQWARCWSQLYSLLLTLVFGEDRLSVDDIDVLLLGSPFTSYTYYLAQGLVSITTYLFGHNILKSWKNVIMIILDSLL